MMTFKLFAVFLACLSFGAARPVSDAPSSTYAYVAAYTAGAPDSDEKLLGIRVMTKTLKITQTPHDIVILVSKNTEEEVRESFRADGFKVVEMTEPRTASDAHALPAPASSSSSSDVSLLSRKERSTAFFERKCPLNHDWIYLYTLTQYKRVVFVEHDSLVFLNMDDLFMCGKFCMVYANENCWNSGVVVIEPSISEFNRWMDHFTLKAARIEKQRQQSSFLLGPSVDCVEEWHDSLLTMFPSLEASPLFHTRSTQSEDPVMRLHLMFSINAIFYYEHFTWALYVINIKIPQESSAFKYQNTPIASEADVNGGVRVHVGIPTEIPAFSVSFHKPKPYHWWPAGYFDLNWYWQDIRHTLLPETNRVIITTALTHIVILACLYFVSNYLTSKYFTAAFRERMHDLWSAYNILPTPASNIAAGADEEDLPNPKEKDEDASAMYLKMKNAALDSSATKSELASQFYTSTANPSNQCLYQVDRRCRAQIYGILLGITVLSCVAAFFAIPMIHSSCPPVVAWPMFCAYHNFGIWLVLRILANVFPTSASLLNFEDPRITSLLPSFLLSIISIIHNRMRLWRHFVEKILVFEIFFVFIILMQTNGFRKLVLSHFGYTSAPKADVPLTRLKSQKPLDSSFV